jgi:hypothetical protein
MRILRFPLPALMLLTAPNSLIILPSTLHIVSILRASLNNQLKRTKYSCFATVFRNTKQSGYDAVSRLSFFPSFLKLNTKLCQQQNGYCASSFPNKNNNGGGTYLSSVFVRLLVSICWFAALFALCDYMHAMCLAPPGRITTQQYTEFGSSVSRKLSWDTSSSPPSKSWLKAVWVACSLEL